MEGYRRQIITTFYGTALLTKIDIAVKFKILQYNIIRETRHNNTIKWYTIIQLISLLYDPSKHRVLSIQFHSSTTRSAIERN